MRADRVPSLAEIPIEALAARIASNDAAALGEAYDRYRILIFSVCRRITGDARLAEEALQDTFVKVWQAADSFDPLRGRFETWLLTIARNIALNMMRRKPLPIVDEDRLNELPQPPGSDPPEATLVKLRREAIGRAIDRLPATQRSVVLMVYFEGLTFAEIADRAAEPLGTIKSRLRLALAKLREFVKDEGLDGL